MRALVVDDSRTVRIIIGNILRELGIEVVEAGDGVEALARLEQDPDLDLILLDWNMPRMNGYDLLRAVRARNDLGRPRILMVTSESQSDQVSKALDAGADEYLMKPFNKEVLIAKLRLMDAVPEE